MMYVFSKFEYVQQCVYENSLHCSQIEKDIIYQRLNATLDVIGEVCSDACLELPCEYGTCHNLGDGAFTCDCDDGWTGENCDERKSSIAY